MLYAIVAIQNVLSELPRPMPQNSVESDHGCTSRIHFDKEGDNLTLTLYNVTLTLYNVTLTLYNVTLTSHKPCKRNNKCDCSKTNGLNEVCVFYQLDIAIAIFN